MTMYTKQRTIPAGKFKANCLILLDQVAMSREVLVITKRGVPVARIAPLEEAEGKPLIGSVQYLQDIVEPTGETWETER